MAPTPSGHQDARMIRVDPEARKRADKAKKGKVIAHTSRKGKEGEIKIGRTSPPITRARKRARQANTTESRTASQDSCTPRNPLQDDHATRDPPKEDVETPTFLAGTQDKHLGLDTPGTPAKNNNPFRPSEGYTPPPPPRPPPTHPPSDNGENMTINTLALVKTVLGLTKDIEHETPAKKFIWGLVELVKAGAIPYLSIQDMERLDKEAMDKAQLTCLVDDYEEQSLEGNATKKDISKLRNEMAVQHQATFKQVVQANEKASELASHNQKMKTILIQINDLFEHLDKSLLKRSKADEINNKALLRVITGIAEIRAQIEAAQGHLTTKVTDDMDVDPQEPRNKTDNQINNNDIEVFSQTQHPPALPDQIQGNAQHPIKVFLQTQDEGVTKKEAPHPIVIPSQTLGNTAEYPTASNRWPPHPSVEDIDDNSIPAYQKKKKQP